MCDISKGKNLLNCKSSVSGLRAIFMANYDDYAMSATSTTSGHTLNTLGTLSAGKVFQFELKHSANTFQQDINSSRDNGTTVFQQVLNFTLNRLSSEMEFQVKMMAWGRPIIFVEANNGLYFVMGKDNGCEIAGNAQMQGTMDALNGYVLTATAMEKEPIYYLAPTAITALNVLVSGQTNVTA